MHLHDVMGWDGPMTHRQYVVWQLWLQMQWNKPDRHDWYTMQVSADVLRAAAGKKGRGIRVDKMRIPFKFRTTDDEDAGFQSMEAEDDDRRTMLDDIAEQDEERWAALADKVEGATEELQRLQDERKRQRDEKRTAAAKKLDVALAGGKVRVVKKPRDELPKGT